MAKRRKQRRNPISILSYNQEFELALSEDKEPENRAGNNTAFIDALQKRAAYFAHRDYVLNEGFGNINDSPGHRPGGWWAFESQEKRNRNIDEWEQLLLMGELSDQEKGLILAQWLQRFELSQGRFKMFPAEKEPFKRQAELLAEHVEGGQVALAALNNFTED